MLIVSRVLTVLYLFLLTISVNAQNYEKKFNREPVVVQNNMGNGDGILTRTANVQRNEELNGKLRELSAKLRQAREDGNLDLFKQLGNQIDDLVGSKVTISVSGPKLVPISESSIQKDGNKLNGTSVITSGNIVATATTTQNTNGRIWVATSHFGNGITDTLFLHYSDNGGDSWVYFTKISFAQSGLDFLADDLDIEVLRNGSAWWIFVTGGYILNGEKNAFVWNMKDDATGVNFQTLPKNQNTDQYWARVVSDYPKYTGTAKVYIVATMDSVINTTTKKVYLRAFTIESPFISPLTIANRNTEQSGSAYGTWWLGAPIQTVTRSDIAYFDSLGAGDRMITSTIFYTGGSASQIIDLTFSDNFMRGTPYIKQYLGIGGFRHSTPILSFSGGNDQLKGCIAALRYEGSDVDAVYIATPDGGSSWFDGYLDNNYTNNTASKADVIAIKGVDGQFKFGWINTDAPNPEFLYNSGTLNSGGSMNFTETYSMSGAGIYPDGIYGGRAGYRLGSDGCFAVFAGQNGFNAYGISGCTNPVSVENHEPLPIEYSLTQNYPNPFNPTTIINYSIPAFSNVVIKIYDVLGKEVATLVNEEKPAGSYKVQFDASNLSSGVYLYKLQSGSFVETKKMTVIK
jgi:hypothetical protein